MAVLGGGAVSYERGTPVPMPRLNRENGSEIAGATMSSSSSLLVSSLELSDAKVYEP